MKFLDKLARISEKNSSLLCVGLDPDSAKLPKPFKKDKSSLLAFNKAIIDATRSLVCAYKPNIAFYETIGASGIRILEKTIEYIGPDIPVILDAKRGDIGHTAAAYAKSIFENFQADATTVSPYLGYDSIRPFMEYQDKGVFVLCLTSNQSSKDFQLAGEEPLYKLIAKQVVEWNIYGNLGLVVGATSPHELKEARQVARELSFLIPGIGAQGGDIKETVKNGSTKHGNGIIINVSRSIMFASDKADFAEAAHTTANNFREEINKYRPKKKA